jgi:inosine-uridine nucleoside N-ribohydrolase
MVPVFIWTDIGTNPDDILALSMALRSPELNIVGISTCADFQGARVQFLKTVLEAEGKTSIPIGRGKGQSKVQKQDREFLGASNNFKETFPDGTKLFEQVLAKHDRVKVITIGPLTDFAVCLERNHSLDSKISWIAMGGALNGEEEYNFSFDPEATSYILQSSFPKKIVPRDLTRQFFLKDEEFSRIRFPAKLKDDFLLQWKRWKVWSGRTQLYLNDPLTVACALDLDSFSYKNIDMKVKWIRDHHQIEVSDNPQSDLEVATGVDRGAFFEMFYNLLG